MAREALGDVSVRINLVEQLTALGIGSAVTRLSHGPVEWSTTYTTGTADGSIDRLWSTSANATTSPTSVDLLGTLASVADGALTTSFVELVLLYVENTSTSGNIIVGDAASNPFAAIFGADGTVIIPPGGCFLWAVKLAGVTPTAGTGDILQIAASTGTVGYKLLLAGRSA
jgi:hypothetical protein